jgi:hypothetical protein
MGVLESLLFFKEILPLIEDMSVIRLSLED